MSRHAFYSRVVEARLPARGALLVRQIEACSPRADTILGRVSIDILGPVPIATLTAHAHILRSGRSVEMLEATLVYDG